MTIYVDKGENADWILSPKRRKEEIAIHERLAKKYVKKGGSKARGKGRWVTLPDGRHVRIGKPRPTLASQRPGARPASEVVDDAPDRLQRILDRASYVPTEFGGHMAGAEGTAARKLGDGSYVIPVRAGRRLPGKGILVHEAVHAHQGELSIPRRDTIEQRFMEAARADNRGAKNPLWGEDMLGYGGELWATATGYLYGSGRRMLEESSPRVTEVVRGVYEGRTGSKARGKGGKIGRWRTLKDGRPIFITGGIPSGGITMHQSGGGATKVTVHGEVDSVKVNKLLHEFEEMPGWATRDIGSIEIHEGDGERFTAGGEEFETGMDYDRIRHRIRVFDANEQISPKSYVVDAGLYHEVGHSLQDRMIKEYWPQHDAVYHEHPQWFEEYGRVKPERRVQLEKEYPVFAMREKWKQAWADGQDGITSYSRAWAKEGRDGETFAEMAKSYFFGGADAVKWIAEEHGAQDLGEAFVGMMDAFSRGTGRKARGRGGKFGRWRTLKGGRPVFITGGTPEGGLSVRTRPGAFGTTLFDTFGDVDSEKVDRLIHDFEEMPGWAVDDIAVIEVYERSGARFTAGGEEFQTGMDYTHSMGRIRVFDANEELSEVFTNDSLYHEVGHNLERRWGQAGNKQNVEVIREHPDWFMPNGDVRLGYARDVAKAAPMGVTWDLFHTAWREGQDGITSYSKAWAREGKYSETIASMAKIYFQDGARALQKVAQQSGAWDLAQAFLNTMDAFSKGQDRKDLEDKARGRGGKFGRWRTLKDGRRVFVSGGIPKGTVYMKRGESRYTKLQAGAGVDPDRVDRLIHDFEELPDWAARDISAIEMTIMPGETFTAGGETFQTGMEYEPTTGRIGIYSANSEISRSFANTGLYHEVGHSIESRYTKAVLSQSAAARDEHPDWFRPGPAGYGRLRSDRQAGYKKAYPLASSWDTWQKAWSGGQDGITAYSEAWAKELGGWGETFAEMTQIYFGSGARRLLSHGKKVGALDLTRSFVDTMEAFSKGQDR